ncbi:MAG: ssl1498 family light-harvesting-like protein [Synechococcaceae cyanobacterium]|nr:ssl1498 family light-harvesting-like protein [Synechococcaceae cyanobacterium]
MQVTEEDGGKLNAFAKEPRMELMEEGQGRSGANRMLLVGGLVLVLVLVAVAARIS